MCCQKNEKWNKLEMNNKQMKINKWKENQKVGYWAWTVAGLKGQESGLLKTKKKEKGKGRRKWQRRRLTGLWRNLLVAGTLDDQMTSVSAQILRRCSTRREEWFYDGQSWF